MAKVKDKQRDKKEKSKKAAAGSGSGTAVATDAARYEDGTPLDRVQYLEAKLILKPDRFTSVQAFRDFGKIVQRTAKKVGVGFIEDREAGLRPEIREIIFGDTPDFRLYNNAFILRRRISYVDGFPVGDPRSSSSSVTRMSRRQRRWMSGRRSPASTASSSKPRSFH